MEKRRTFLLLVLLAVVAAWAFTLYTQRVLEEGAQSRRSRAARSRHFASTEPGHWQIVEPDETISQALSLDPAAPAWIKAAPAEEPLADGWQSVQAEPGPVPDLLQIRQGSSVRLLDVLLQAALDFEIPQGQDIKHAIWLSPDRQSALVETGDDVGNIALSYYSAKSWNALALEGFKPLVGTERFSPQWSYLGFEARDASSTPFSLVFQPSSGKWIRRVGWDLAGLDEDGTIHFSKLEDQDELSFDKAGLPPN